jgi:hypothetical protein
MAAAVAKCEIVLAAKEEWSSAWGAAALVLVALAPA